MNPVSTSTTGTSAQLKPVRSERSTRPRSRAPVAPTSERWIARAALRLGRGRRPSSPSAGRERASRRPAATGRPSRRRGSAASARRRGGCRTAPARRSRLETSPRSASSRPGSRVAAAASVFAGRSPGPSCLARRSAAVLDLRDRRSRPDRLGLPPDRGRRPVPGVQADERRRREAFSEHASALACSNGEGALPEEGSVTAGRTATIPRPDEPPVGAGDEAPLPTEVRPMRPQLKAGAGRPSAQYLHCSAIELHVVVDRSGNRSPGEQRRRADSRARRRRKQRRGGSRRPQRRDRPAADGGSGIDIPCLVDCADLEPVCVASGRRNAFGEVHRARPRSRACTPNSVASFAENVKRAERLVVRLRGADRSVVWGEVASIRQVREAAVPMFPTASVGRTTNVCAPSTPGTTTASCTARERCHRGGNGKTTARRPRT